MEICQKGGYKLQLECLKHINIEIIMCRRSAPVFICGDYNSCKSGPTEETGCFTQMLIMIMYKQNLGCVSIMCVIPLDSVNL